MKPTARPWRVLSSDIILRQAQDEAKRFLPRAAQYDGLGFHQIKAAFYAPKPLIEVIEACIEPGDIGHDNGRLLLNRADAQSQGLDGIEDAIKLCIYAIEALAVEVRRFVGHGSN
jgi:hypothetical protein